MSTQIGPSVKKLIAHKMSRDVMPPGGGFRDGVKVLTTPGALGAAWKKAHEWVQAAIVAVRQATEPNPWKNATDEDIAAELLRQIDERNSAHKHKLPPNA